MDNPYQLIADILKHSEIEQVGGTAIAVMPESLNQFLVSKHQYVRTWLQNTGLSELKLYSEGSGQPYIFQTQPLTVNQQMTEDIMTDVQERFPSLVWTSNRLGLHRGFYPLLERLEDSENLAGLTLIETNHQCVVNAVLADALPCDPSEAVERDVKKFTPAIELAKVEDATRLHGSEGSTFEVTYLSTLDDERSQWREFTVHFQVIIDRFGKPFRLGEVLDLQPAKPIENAVFLTN